MNALNTALQQTQATTTSSTETILSLPHQLKKQLPLSDTNRVTGVGWERDNRTRTNLVHDLVDQTGLRVVRMNLNVACHD